MALIRDLLGESEVEVLLSGRSPVGGVDIWAEHTALELGLAVDIKVPRQNKWDAEYGYKQRNLDIARGSDIVHVIVAASYPPDYVGRRFTLCYHCKGDRPEHVKSGGCWTGNKAIAAGNKAVWHIIEQELRERTTQRA